MKRKNIIPIVLCLSIFYAFDNYPQNPINISYLNRLMILDYFEDESLHQDMIENFKSNQAKRKASRELNKYSERGVVWMTILLDSNQMFTNYKSSDPHLSRYLGYLRKNDSSYVLSFYPKTGGGYQGYRFQFKIKNDTISLLSSGYVRIW